MLYLAIFRIYLELWNIVGPIRLDTLNSAIRKGYFHKDLNTALISVLHKPGRDPESCSSYRPISLINADIQIYSKFIAMHLDKVVRKLINPDQAGFLKGRLAPDNVRWLLHVITDAKKTYQVDSYFSKRKKRLIAWYGDIYGKSWENSNSVQILLK